MHQVVRYLFLVALLLSACSRSVEPFGVSHIDRNMGARSQYPVAADPQRVGTYAGRAKSGAGYFYDEVLEFRVWFHPERGADDLASGKDYFAAFSQYERAEAFAKNHEGAEEPLVLVRQLEWIDEPEPHQYVAKRGERLTEWKPRWLLQSKRGPDSIEQFLRHQRRSSD